LLIDLLDAVVRFLVLVQVADYLNGPHQAELLSKIPELSKLSKPSLGDWVNILRSFSKFPTTNAFLKEVKMLGSNEYQKTAVLKLRRSDYTLQGKRARLRLLEKGNKEKLVWLHHEAEQYLDAYLEAAGINDTGAPVSQTLDKIHRFTGDSLSRRDMLRIVKERCAAAELSNCTAFRGFDTARK
jgi:hypothetical protein